VSGYYRIEEGTPDQRQSVAARLPRLGELGAGLERQVVTAWVTSWRSSPHPDLDAMPYSLVAPGYPLLRHVSDVTEVALALADQAARTWQTPLDRELLLTCCLLHDVDKPLLYVPSEQGVVLSDDTGEVPHGVLGAFLLRELGVDDTVAAIVATHAAASPFHSRRREAWVLHYADFFATDHVLMSVGRQPYYQPGPGH